MTINYYYYPRFSDYEDRRINKIRVNSYSINTLTLIKACISMGVGLMGYRNFSKSLLVWRTLNVMTFVDSDFKFKNIDMLESSEKVSASFFIGMVFAHIHMQEKYNVRFTEHLKSSDICYKPEKDNEKTPDLWGLDIDNNISYLIEAKGSLIKSNCIKKDRIDSAYEQLKAILEVQHKIHNSTTIYSKDYYGRAGYEPMEKIIVATHPDDNYEITQHVIDPEERGEKILYVDGNKTVYQQYINLVNLIDEVESEIYELNDVKFRVIDLDLGDSNYSLGIMESIYKIFKNTLDFKELYYDVNKQLDILSEKIDEERESKDYSVGLEGIIIVNSDNLEYV